MNKLLLWDFDGTLAYRDGMWAACLAETLEASEPGRGVIADDLRPLLRDGFPWHSHEVPHPELSTAEAWWESVEAVLARAYEGVGLAAGRARELASEAHLRYVDCGVGWSLFDDTLAVLDELREDSWSHAILSNHVPELRRLVEGLGLAELMGAVLSSAETGYEKPHPQAFALALERFGNPEQVWMIGDNPVADVAGAEAVGIPAILARTEAATANRHAATLHDVRQIILSEPRAGRRKRTPGRLGVRGEPVNHALRPGDAVLIRSVWRGRVRWAVPQRFVGTDEDRLVFYRAQGSQVKGMERDAEGRYLRQWLRGDDLVDYTWSLGPVLQLVRPHEGHTVEVCWDPAWSLGCWYVNLQAPLRRTPLGFDMTDWALDIRIEPDGTWAWKDEDDFNEAIALGILSEDSAAAVRAEGERVISRQPWPTGWEDWRPPDDWTPLPLPAGWAAIES